jgi:ABC-type bacteriocin/lantibiotic exporter with double-glycine peptidase domain
MNLLRELWGILTPHQRRYVLLAQLICLVMAFSTVTGIAAIAPFFAVLGDPQLIDHQRLLHWLYVNAGFASKRRFVVALGVAFIVVVLIVNLVNVLGSLAMNRLALAIGNELQTTLFGEYLNRPYRFHTATSSTTLFNNVIYETMRLSNGILQNLFQLFTNSVTAAFIIVSVLLLNPAACIAMLAVLGGGYVLIYLVVRNRLLRCGEEQSRLSTEQIRIVNEGFGAIKEISLLQVQDSFRRAFERASRAVALVAANTQAIGQSPRNLMECVAVAGLVGLALVLAGSENMVGGWLGQLTFLAFAVYRLLPSLQQAFAGIVRIRADRAGLALIAPDLRSARAAVPVVLPAAWPRRPEREIRLEGVSFRYSPDRPWAVESVSMCIPARSAVAFVGANGSGKTTLADLIAGLLTAATGSVQIDGIHLSADNRASWQARIAYVPQSIFLLDATVAQNIALGVRPADVHGERLRNAVQLAQLDELIKTLPGELDHVIGEKGVRLSGGQRQRIGIARALYRDASVLIMDEATNALDGLTEQELMATLGRLRGRYTTIVIAHRPSTVSTCDVIFELDGGRLVGSGTPGQMLQRSAAFQRMAAAR